MKELAMKLTGLLVISLLGFLNGWEWAHPVSGFSVLEDGGKGSLLSREDSLREGGGFITSRNGFIVSIPKPVGETEIFPPVVSGVVVPVIDEHPFWNFNSHPSEDQIVGIQLMENSPYSELDLDVHGRSGVHLDTSRLSAHLSGHELLPPLVIGEFFFWPILPFKASSFRVVIESLTNPLSGRNNTASHRIRDVDFVIRRIPVLNDLNAPSLYWRDVVTATRI